MGQDYDSRTGIIREALSQNNMAGSAQQRRRQLMKVSLKVRKESMKVNSEFDTIEDAPNTIRLEE